MTGQELALLLQGHRYPSHNEDDLQQKISSLLLSRDIAHSREVRLNDKDRPDFMVGSIAIEVKIASSRSTVLTQIHRYAQCAEITEIVLVTNRFRHLNMPALLNDKPIHVANLLGGAF